MLQKRMPRVLKPKLDQGTFALGNSGLTNSDTRKQKTATRALVLVVV